MSGESKLRKPVRVLLIDIKLINLIQKYVDITELYTFIL